MKFNSTRGEVKGFTFESALFSGFAADGGLFVPESVPKLDIDTLREWKKLKLSYPEVVRKIFRLYVSEDEISEDALEAATTAAFNSFYRKEVIPIKEVKDKNGRSIKIAELFHGRTGSFKDLALSLVGQLLEYFMTKRGGHITVIVGTSGDTGSAVIDSIRNLSSVDIIVLYPKGMISEVQEIQLKSATEDNVHLFQVEGTSDDIDIPITKCFPDERLISINAVNWARIMIQIAHYVYLYVSQESDEPIQVIVPSGASGNLTSGIFAREMGVPVTLYSATNRNDCLSVLLNDGELHMGNTVIATAANAMDIGFPYNLERVFYLCGANAETITSLITSPGRQKVPEELLERIRFHVKGATSVDDEQIFETMKSIWENNNNYVICPHTATGVNYFTDKLAAEIPETTNSNTYVLATASPFKFADAVKKSGIPDEWEAQGSELTNALKGVQLKEPKLMKKGEDWYKILQDEIAAIETKRTEKIPSGSGDVSSAGTSIINSTEAEAVVAAAAAEKAVENVEPAATTTTTTTKPRKSCIVC